MTDKEKKCIWCGSTAKYEDYYIQNNWVYCPNCKTALFDVGLQDKDHWSKKYKLKKY